MSNPNDYSPPKTREPLPPHVEETPEAARAQWEATRAQREAKWAEYESVKRAFAEKRK